MNWTITTLLISLAFLQISNANEKRQECGKPEAIQESLQKSLDTPINCSESSIIDSLPLFELVSCFKDESVWIENMEFVQNKLKENTNEKSISNLFLLVHTDFVLNMNISDENRQKLLEIKKEIPQVAEQVLTGRVCGEVTGNEYNRKHKAFIVTKYYYPTSEQENHSKAIKFVPDDKGSISAMFVTIDNRDMILLMDKFSGNEIEFDFPVTIERGRIEKVLPEESDNVSEYHCVQVGYLLAEFMPRLYEPTLAYCRTTSFLESVLQAA